MAGAGIERAYKREYPSRLGSFILWLNRHRPNLEIRILKWSFGFIKFFGRGSMLLDLTRWFPHRRIDFKFDTKHPVGCSHHQKIVVIDDAFAVCGGIDMTTRRWDTREHLEEDDRRREPNKQPYAPWHDITMMLEGEAARALGDLGRMRWKTAGAKALAPIDEDTGSSWPDELEAHFEDVEVGIARTRAAHADLEAVSEVEELHVRHITEAKNFIYFENQYFTSRVIGEAIATRLEEPDPPEIIVVHPKSADGWMETQAMDPARDALVEAMRKLDTKNRFHIYVPYTGETPIYVHAKLTIVDDRVLRIGSANLNNRSMGLDSECDVFIDAEREGNGHAAQTITQLRHSLLAEHLGVAEEDMADLLAQHGSMAATIAAIGRNNSRSLRKFEPEDHADVLNEAAAREILDPEEPDAMFTPRKRDDGLFRKGGRLARARGMLTKKAI